MGSGGYKTLSLAGPNRLVVDFPDSSAVRNLKMPAAQGVVTAVRTGQPVPGTFRVVFDLAESVAPFRPQMQREGNESKLVIEWPGDGPAVVASRPAATPAVPPQAPANTPAPTPTPAESAQARTDAARATALLTAQVRQQASATAAAPATPTRRHPPRRPRSRRRVPWPAVRLFLAGRDPRWAAHRSGGDAAGHGACAGTDAGGTAAPGHAQ